MRALYALPIWLAACTLGSSQTTPDAGLPDSGFGPRNDGACSCLDGGSRMVDAGRPPLSCLVDASLPDAGSDGGALTIAAGQRHPVRVVADGSRIFWANGGDPCGPGSVVRAGRDGSNAVALTPAPTESPCELALDPSSLYFADCGPARSLIRADPNGNGGAFLGQAVAPGGIAYDSRQLYWIDRGTGAADGQLMGLVRETTGLGPAVPLVAGLRQPSVVAADDAGVYFISDGGATLVQLSGNFALANGLVGATALALDGDDVYWTETGGAENGLIRAVSRHGGTPRTIASGLVQPVALAVDATTVYWTSLDGRVEKAPKLGGLPTMLADGQLEPSSIAVDSQFVYWTDSRRGTVMRAPR